MKFKYQQEYDALANTCPPIDFTAKDLENVYRWVFDSIDDPNNFLPQFFKNPKRFLSKDDLTKCKALGLSFFDNLEGAMKRYNELKTDIGENVKLTLGANVAKGVIIKSDGVNGEQEKHGHFTHHASENAFFEKNFTIVKKL